MTKTDAKEASATDTKAAAAKFEVWINPDLELGAYVFGSSIIEGDEEETGFREGVPRRVSEAEYDLLAADRHEGRQIVVKKRS